MLIYTSQLRAVEDALKILEKYKAKPVVIKGGKVDFVWPPQPVNVPIHILKYFPQNVYVYTKGKQLIIIP